MININIELKPGLNVEINIPTKGVIVSVDGFLNKTENKITTAYCTVQLGNVQKKVIVMQSDIIVDED